MVQETSHDFSTPRGGGSRVASGWLGGGSNGGQKVAFGGFEWPLPKPKNGVKCDHRRFGLVRSIPKTASESKRSGGGWVRKCKKWFEKWARVDRRAANQGCAPGRSRKIAAIYGFVMVLYRRIDIYTCSRVVIDISTRVDIYICRFPRQMSIASSQQRLRDPQSPHVRSRAGTQSRKRCCRTRRGGIVRASSFPSRIYRNGPRPSPIRLDPSGAVSPGRIA